MPDYWRKSKKSEHCREYETGFLHFFDGIKLSGFSRIMTRHNDQLSLADGISCQRVVHAGESICRFICHCGAFPCPANQSLPAPE